MNVKIGILNSDLTPSGKTTEAAKAVCYAKALNCTFLIYNGTDFGTAFENGTGTGLVGAIQAGEFDSFEPYFTPTYSRFHAIDFSEPYFYSEVIMVTRAPRSVLGGFSFSILFALRWETWCAFISAFLITAIFIAISAGKVFENPPNMIVAIFDQWVSLFTHKHHDKYLILNYVRIAVACFSLAWMVLASCYTAVLFSEKLKPSNSLPYEDFESFITCLEESRCRLVTFTLSMSYIQVLFGPESDMGRRAGLTFAYNPPLVVANTEAAKNAILEEQSTFLVWIGDKGIFDAAFQSKADCTFFALETGYREAWTFPVRKHSALKAILDDAAVAFQELGLRRGMSLRYEVSSQKCDPRFFERPGRVSDSGATYADLCLLAVGTGCACISILIELAIDRWRNRRLG